MRVSQAKLRKFFCRKCGNLSRRIIFSSKKITILDKKTCYLGFYLLLSVTSNQIINLKNIKKMKKTIVFLVFCLAISSCNFKRTETPIGEGYTKVTYSDGKSKLKDPNGKEISFGEEDVVSIEWRYNTFYLVTLADGKKRAYVPETGFLTEPHAKILFGGKYFVTWNEEGYGLYFLDGKRYCLASKDLYVFFSERAGRYFFVFNEVYTSPIVEYNDKTHKSKVTWTSTIGYTCREVGGYGGSDFSVNQAWIDKLISQSKPSGYEVGWVVPADVIADINFYWYRKTLPAKKPRPY